MWETTLHDAMTGQSSGHYNPFTVADMHDLRVVYFDASDDVRNATMSGFAGICCPRGTHHLSSDVLAYATVDLRTSLYTAHM